MDITNTLLLILAVTLAIVVHLWRRRLNYWKDLGISCNTPHPIFGSFDFKNSPSDAVWNYYKKYKGSAPFVGFFNILRPAVFVLDTQLAKNILIRDFSHFTDRGVYYNEKDDPLSAHLLALDGTKWRQLRQKLSPTFTSGKMKFMYPTIVEVGHRFVDTMREIVSKNSVVDVKDILARFTTDIIGTCAFGIECNSLKDPHSEFREMGRVVFTKLNYPLIIVAFMQTFRDLARKLHMKVTHKDIHNFFMRVVRETVTFREQNNIKRNDFLDLLIELKKKKNHNSDELGGLTIEEVAAQVFVFFLGGFETSSTTMCFALYELARHQDIQDKCRQEINDILTKHDNKLTYECINDMHYLDQVISETLRMHSVFFVVTREAVTEYEIPDSDYTVKKGQQVMIPIIGYHMDSDYYPEPYKFNPDRFTAEEVNNRDPILWLPFGVGPRNCIGKRFGLMQTRLGLALFLKNFRVTFCKETQDPIKLDPRIGITSIKDELYLKVTPV